MTIKTKMTIGKMLTTYLPMVCAFIVVIDSICNFYNIKLHIFSIIGGTSIIVWIYFWYISYMYNLCIYQKMFIYYLVFSNSIAIIDTYIGIPINDLQYLLVYCISFGITVLLYGYFKYQENKSKHL